MSPERGVLLVDPRDQSVVKDDLRKHAEVAKDWEYHEQAVYLYRWAVIFKERLLDPVLVNGRQRMPDPVVSFDRMRVEMLAGYTLVRNPQGLLDEITFNTVHFVEGKWEYGEWGLLETLLHEQCHLWQQNFGRQPVVPGRAYHNKEFVDKCESLGLHSRLGSGVHFKPSDGVFESLMKEYGIAKPEQVETEDGSRLNWWDLLKDLLGEPKKEGRSTLSKWSCPCGQNIRVGRQDWPGAKCNKCQGEYARVDGVTAKQTLYEANKENQAQK